jgi:two-component system phosphate regulon sensor histidine kinase PhoR
MSCTNRLPLTRRLLGQYLLFGCASVLTLGTLFAWWAGAAAREHEVTVDRVRGAVQRASEALASGDAANLQLLFEQLGREDWVAWCGAVSRENCYLAHSQPAKVGRAAEMPAGLVETAILVVERLPLDELGGHSPEGSMVAEYWVAMPEAAEGPAALQIGVAAQRAAQPIYGFLEGMPHAVLAPLIVLLAGGGWLRKTASQDAAIEHQLMALAEARPEGTLSLAPVPQTGPAAVGWNKLVEANGRLQSLNSLEAVLSRTLGGVREQKAERILNSLPEGVAFVDSDQAVSFANAAFCTLLNWDADQIRNSPITEQIERVQALSSDVRQQLQSESRPVVFELARGAMTGDGVLRVSRSPLLSPAGETLGQIWMLRDVTQQRLADEARAEFVNSATHELRTPLTNIRAYAETLALNEIADVEKQREFLNIITSEAERLGRFVDELLNVSGMESGALMLHRQAVDLERLFAEVVEKVRGLMEQKDLAFKVIIPAKLPGWKLDKEKTLAAIVNLLGNAVKYTPAGGGVTFEVVCSEHELRVSVEDTGIGISSEELPKIASKFFRSADQRVRDIPGSGLGLALVQEVARLQGGSLTVHSELNKGSKFTLTFPAS